MMRRLAGLGLGSSGVGGSTKKGASSAASAISRPLFKLLNDQGNREWEASLSYAAAGVWFAHNKLKGSAEWYCSHWLSKNPKHLLIPSIPPLQAILYI